MCMNHFLCFQRIFLYMRYNRELKYLMEKLLEEKLIFINVQMVCVMSLLCKPYDEVTLPVEVSSAYADVC